ncbi:hypothetical protein [Nocardioides marmoribigeumensis]|uniref:Ig-like domain repeat protein n=1 Tax=Nocardioides marmoribigeumensis TaxID=433649 RepID=A0ABU2BTN8_9ACTN|nr:hypothetical protein [Nocardioides marmoribigeumensis]MDR7361981.1 hypothetical protein [Nocardioides marmoribigeumensis]
MRTQIALRSAVLGLVGIALVGNGVAVASEATQVATSTDATSANAFDQYGTSQTITFVVKNTADANTRPTGTVNVKRYPTGGSPTGTGTDVSLGPVSGHPNWSSASYTFVNDAVGSYSVLGQYAGNSTFGSSSDTFSVTVFRRNTSTSASAATPYQSANFSAVVTSVAGADNTNAPNPQSGTVTFSLAGPDARTGSKALSGSNSVTLDMTDLTLAGDYTLTTNFAQTSSYAASSGTTSFSIGTATKFTDFALKSNGQLSAKFVTDDGNATLLGGRNVTLKATSGGTTYSCTATTGSSGSNTGVASCTVAGSYVKSTSYSVAGTYVAVGLNYKGTTTSGSAIAS